MTELAEMWRNYVTYGLDSRKWEFEINLTQ